MLNCLEIAVFCNGQLIVSFDKHMQVLMAWPSVFSNMLRTVLSLPSGDAFSKSIPTTLHILPWLRMQMFLPVMQAFAKQYVFYTSFMVLENVALVLLTSFLAHQIFFMAVYDMIEVQRVRFNC